MNHQSYRRGAKRLLALVGAAALVLGGAVVGASSANAVDPPQVGNIVGTEGTLTIHKHAGNPTGSGTGQVIDDSNLGVGVDGVQFNIERVTNGGVAIDLTTTAGWDLAKQASDGFNSVTGALPAGFGVVSETTVTTAGGGLADATLDFGLYRVTELPNAMVDTIAPPFLVSVPFPSSGSWLYDVHVYPKNKLKDNPTKTVSTPVTTEGLPAVVEGSLVTWTITAPVPRVDGNTVDNFTITDALDSRLKFESAVVKLDGVTLTLGSETYSLAHTGADGVTGQGGTVVIDLIGDTLDGLQTGQVVTVELKTSVHGVGEITNIAVRNVNEQDTNIGEPQTNWGQIEVLKQNAQQSVLQGAKFELYKEDRTTLVYAEETTDPNGVILFDALWLGNGDDTSEVYCLKETQAPPGYVTPTGDAAFTCVTVSTADGEGSAVHEVPVTNQQQQGPNLPLTGATGTAMIMAGGLALMGTAVVAGLLASRRRGEAAERR